MGPHRIANNALEIMEEIIGYLNFSSGTPSAGFLANMNRLFGLIAAEPTPAAGGSEGGPTSPPLWRRVGRSLQAGLEQLRDRSDAFREVRQARAIVRLVFDEVLPGYREFHRDLLFHQTEDELFAPLFVGRVCEAVLSEGPPWEPSQRIVRGALGRLNDFVGHRPVAVLENGRKLQPYDHEPVRPIPLYIADVGVGLGRYHDLISKALEVLDTIDSDLLHQAWFDPEMLDELALDPRAFDFDHPVNRRPNYHFGGWDPRHIDNQGRYRRFVLQQVTLDALLDRIDHPGKLPADEALFEAAVLLIGTMLMGAAIPGSGPDSHDSATTLATLMPHIAGYRDAYYQQFLARLKEPRAGRLRAEATKLKQPFGAARQDLNHKLGRRRAEQLQHVSLARLFSRMGYTEAATRQAHVVPVPSARMRCEIDCQLTTAHLDIDQGQTERAAARLPKIESLLHRGIECGALADPWSILGFGGQFSLFPAVENSVHDHRVDELIDLVTEIFSLYARLEKEAAAAGKEDLQQGLSNSLRSLAEWWDQFASTEVSDVTGVSGHQAWESSAQVAKALGAWREAGSAAGDVAFWRRHVEQFKSPKAYALLVDALLEKRDPVASMALLIHWLGSADVVALEEGDYSFHGLALCWMEDLWAVQRDQSPGVRSSGARGVSSARLRQQAEWADPTDADPSADPANSKAPASRRDRWALTRKFFDFLEANADEFWSVPQLELTDDAGPREALDDEDEDGQSTRRDAEDNLFSAAYENVSYRDTTDDGFDSSMMEGGASATELEFSREAERISDRLEFLVTLAQLWKLAADSARPGNTTVSPVARDPNDVSPVARDRPRTDDPTDQAQRRKKTKKKAKAKSKLKPKPKSKSSVGRKTKKPPGAQPQPESEPESEFEADYRGAVAGWLAQAVVHRRELLKLLQTIHRYPIPKPRSNSESLMEYDRRRAIKEGLLERTILAYVETADTARFLQAAIDDPSPTARPESWEAPAERVLRAVYCGDVEAVRADWQGLLAALERERLLYIPTYRGGNPRRIASSRCIQRVLGQLLEHIPRLGLLTETYQLIETIQEMERRHPAGPGAITEFDRLFEIGCRGIVQCLVVSAERWPGDSNSVDFDLVDCLDRMSKLLRDCWLSHSRNIRLSVLETVLDHGRWKAFKGFISRYGHDLFTQHFLNYGNLQAILHQGVDQYLESLSQEHGDGPISALLDDLDGPIPRDEAVRWLELVIEAVVDNYSEYVDYNSTTTQSDHGEMLYTLMDFLRLQSSYDRMAWNLRPIVVAHETLVRRGREKAASLWREIVGERCRSVADEHWRRFQRLSRKYGMRLPSIADRLGERFVRPLAIDQLCALVRPAMDELALGGEPEPFARLEREVGRFTKEPVGVGFDVPAWLDALESEVVRVRSRPSEQEGPPNLSPRFPQVRITLANAMEQMSEWD